MGRGIFSRITTANGLPATDIPKKLYKFMEPKWAHRLCKSGQFLVGTLFDFRRQEKHGHGVLDIGEGTINHIEEVEECNYHQLTEVSKQAWKFTGDGPPPRFRGFSIHTPRLSGKDRYVYCTSLEPGWNVEIDPSYTACVEIFDPPTFIGALAAQLALQSAISGRLIYGPVRYIDRDVRIQTKGDEHVGNLPADGREGLLKPPSFHLQREFRVIFDPTGLGPYKPIPARNLALTRCCRVLGYRPGAPCDQTG